MNKVPKLRFPEFQGQWEEKKLGKLGDFFKGSTLSKSNLSEYGKPCILYGELYTKYGEVIKDVVSKTDLDSKNLVVGNKNDVLVPSSGESAIDIATASCLQESDVLLGGDLNVFRPYKENGIFISYQLNNSKRKDIAKLAQGASVVHIYNEQLKKIKVNITNEREQEKIASFFSLIDEKIKKQQQKIEALQEYKKGMIQKIFSQEIRFKDQNGEDYPEWEEKGFGEFLTSRVLKQVPSQEAPLMAFTATGGIEPKGDRYDRSFLVKSDEKLYKRTELNDFIYSSNNLDVGSIGLNKYGTAVISDVYEIFVINKDVSYNFISEFIKTPKVMSKIISYRQGVMYGQYRIHAEDFLKIKEFIPCLEEQQKIAKFLTELDIKIEKEQEKLQQLQQWKKGLLQQMFV